MPLGAGKIMGLSKDELAEALRISIVQGIPLLEARRGEISHWKACTVPNAGRNTVLASLLAKSGLKGPPNIFKGEAGFFKAVTKGYVELEKFAMEDNNDSPIRIMKLSIKRYPAGFSQTAIEAAIKVKNSLLIQDPDMILSVEIGTLNHGYSVMGKDPSRWRPKTRETADHSLPFVVACGIMFNSVDIEHFEAHVLEDSRLKELMDTIKVYVDLESQSAWPEQALNKVTITLRDGRSKTAKSPYYKGHFKQPMNIQEIKTKFNKLTNGLIPIHRRNDFFNTVNKLVDLEKVKDFYGMIVVERKN